MSRRPDPNPLPELDLHGMGVQRARRRLQQELHASRVRGQAGLRVLVGRGWGSPGQRPVLGPAIEAWLKGSEARALGVRSFARSQLGGALDLRLGPRG